MWGLRGCGANETSLSHLKSVRLIFSFEIIVPPDMDAEHFSGRCQCALCAAVFDGFEQLHRHLGSRTAPILLFAAPLLN
jgi:hypothetical protein